MQIIRGTTPTIIINVKDDIDFSQITSTWIFISQRGKVRVDKTIRDITVNPLERRIKLPLSQEDTLNLKEGDATIQVRILMSDGTALSSFEKEIEVLPTGKEGEIEPEQFTPEQWTVGPEPTIERIKLNLIPIGTMPICHASQFDKKRQIEIEIYNGAQPYFLSDEELELVIKKPDGNLVSMDIPYEVGSNSVIFETTEQTCAVAGKCLCELRVEKGDVRIGSLNFYLQVEGAPDEGGVQSQSEINNLNRQIDEHIDEVLPDMVENVASAIVEEVAPAIVREVAPAVIEDVAPPILERLAPSAVESVAPSIVERLVPTEVAEVAPDVVREVAAPIVEELVPIAVGDNYYNKTQTDAKVAGLIDDTQALLNKTWSSKKSNDEIVSILPACTVSGSIAEFTTELSEPIISLMNDIDYDGNVVNNIKLANIGGSPENAPFFKGLIIGTKTFIDLSTLNWSYGNNNGHWARYYFFANLSDRALINTVLSNDYAQTGYATNSPDAPDKSIFLPTNNTYIYICDSNITSVSDFVREMSGHYLIYDPATNTQGISESNFKAVCDSFEIASDYKIVDISGYSVYGGMLALTPIEAILTSTTNADGTIKETPDTYNLTGIADFVSFIGQNNIFADSGDIIECKFKTKDIVSAVLSQSDILTGKKWAVCGDSFTAGATNTKIKNGKYAGENYAYPFLIGNRVGIEVLRFFASGRTLAYPSDGSFHNSLTDSAQKYYYQNIPEDIDYITIYLGINDSHHENGGGGDGEDPTGIIPLGTISDNTINTYYGAWNVVLTWLMTYRPFAHIGIIVSNGCDRVEYRTAQLDIAKKYGIPYIDMNGDSRTPVMIRSMNPDISNDIKTIVLNKQAVDIDGSKTGTINLHPNDNAHLYESYFIENFLRTI